MCRDYKCIESFPHLLNCEYFDFLKSKVIVNIMSRHQEYIVVKRNVETYSSNITALLQYRHLVASARYR